jgi:hypothetical protein
MLWPAAEIMVPFPSIGINCPFKFYRYFAAVFLRVKPDNNPAMQQSFLFLLASDPIVIYIFLK